MGAAGRALLMEAQGIGVQVVFRAKGLKQTSRMKA